MYRKQRQLATIRGTLGAITLGGGATIRGTLGGGPPMTHLHFSYFPLTLIDEFPS